MIHLHSRCDKGEILCLKGQVNGPLTLTKGNPDQHPITETHTYPMGINSFYELLQGRICDLERGMEYDFTEGKEENVKRMSVRCPF
jgi:hypothetical protein